MGDFSNELCGGTHVKNTAQIRFFKILSEAGVSSGIRRIEAIAGEAAIRFVLKHFDQSQQARQSIGIQESWTQFLDSSSSALVEWIEDKKNHIKDLEKQIKNFKKEQVDTSSILKNAKSFKKQTQEGQFIVCLLDLKDREIMSQIADQLKQKLKNGVVVLCGLDSENQSHPIIISVSKDISSVVNAGSLLKDLSKDLGGKGGGRPDFAQGAIIQREKLTSFLDNFFKD